MKRVKKCGGSRGPGRGTKRLTTQNIKAQLEYEQQQRQGPKPIAYVSGYGYVYA